jgi:hypothetical protein
MVLDYDTRIGTDRGAKAQRSTGPKTEAGKAHAVMSQRLTEQACDMLFENPPEALAALKGSSKLADLKVLPGCPPIRASGAI